MMIYSCLLAVALLLSSPWWLYRIFTNGRYRIGLRARVGVIRPSLDRAVRDKQVIWLHAVSVGEVLAAERLVLDLEESLSGQNSAWVIAVSTTTAAGFKLAKRKLPGCPVFFIPLDFATTVRRYLKVLQPRMLILMESELWPRLLVECKRANVPVVVVNARISDRSFPRYRLLKLLWKPLLAKVTFFFAQGEESGERLKRIGVDPVRIHVVGNLKYDAPIARQTPLVRALNANLPMADLIVCGSTLEGEEVEILAAWKRLMNTGHRGVLMLAPRHPERFTPVVRLAGPGTRRVSKWLAKPEPIPLGTILVLDTVGDLASVYQAATVAFLGGSLVPRGGHNPLEPARFGVPVVMGPSYENFREIVEGMRAADAIRILDDGDLSLALHELMREDLGQPQHQATGRGQAMGARGRRFYKDKTGATARTLPMLLDLLGVAPSARTVPTRFDSSIRLPEGPAL